MIQTAKVIVAYNVEEQKINEGISLLKLIKREINNPIDNKSASLEEIQVDQVTLIEDSSNESYLNIREDDILKNAIIFPHPLNIIKIGLPVDLSNPENVKMNYSDVPDGTNNLYIGIKISQEMKIPFIVLETSEGTKIISYKDVYDTKPKVEKKERKSTKKRKKTKKHKRAKRSTKKRKAKSKNSRKSG